LSKGGKRSRQTRSKSSESKTKSQGKVSNDMSAITWLIFVDRKESEQEQTGVTVASIVTASMGSEPDTAKDGSSVEGAISPTTPKKVKRRTAEAGDGKKTPEPKKRKKTEVRNLGTLNSKVVMLMLHFYLEQDKEKQPKEPKQKKEKTPKEPKPEGEKTKRKTKKQKQEEEAQAQALAQTTQNQTEGGDRKVEQSKMLEAEKGAAEALLGVSSSLPPFAAEANKVQSPISLDDNFKKLIF